MASSLLILISLTITAMLSLALAGLSVWRLMSYIKAYKLERGQYTPLLGFIPLRAIVVLYVIGVATIGGFSIGIFMTLAL